MQKTKKKDHLWAISPIIYKIKVNQKPKSKTQNYQTSGRKHEIFFGDLALGKVLLIMI